MTLSQVTPGLSRPTTCEHGSLRRKSQGWHSVSRYDAIVRNDAQTIEMIGRCWHMGQKPSHGQNTSPRNSAQAARKTVQGSTHEKPTLFEGTAPTFENNRKSYS